MNEVPIIRVGMTYKFDAPNATGWFVLRDIRHGKHGIELICNKGKLTNDRIFTKDQISAWEKPKGIIAENYVELDNISGYKLYSADIVWWAFTHQRGRKAGTKIVKPEGLAA